MYMYLSILTYTCDYFYTYMYSCMIAWTCRPASICILLYLLVNITFMLACTCTMHV